MRALKRALGIYRKVVNLIVYKTEYVSGRFQPRKYPENLKNVGLTFN